MKFLTPIIVILLAVALYFFYIGPQITTVEALSSQKAAYENVLAQSQELAQKRDSLLAVYNGISSDDLNRLSEVVPPSFDMVSFANDLNALAGKDGLSIQGFKVNEPTPTVLGQVVTQPANQLYQTTAVSVSMSGSYSSLIAFLKDIETSLRLIDVSGLSIKQSTANNSLLQFSLDLKTYSLASSAAASSTIAETDTSNTNSSGVIGADILNLVNKMRATTLDTSVFSSNLWSSLINSSVPLTPEAQGRANPFAPIGTGSVPSQTTPASATSSKGASVAGPTFGPTPIPENTSSH